VISGLRGVVAARGTDHVDIDVGGVIYRTFVSLTTLAATPVDGKTVQLHVHTAVREDAITLYGFAQEAERQTFGHLLAVQGVGAKVALSVLGVPTDQLARAVADEDIAFLKKIPHVGPKTAGRIVIELRDRLPRIAWTPEAGGNGAILSGGRAGAGAKDELATALGQLGYRPSEVDATVRSLKGRIDAGEPLEELVRLALGKLSTGP
jgi:Holliday junction DNA helicase RuvA